MSAKDVFVALLRGVNLGACVRGREIYLHVPDGFGRSKLTIDYFERRLGVEGTARNWRTLLKLLAPTSSAWTSSASREAIAAMGGPERTPREAVEALDEAIAIIRLFWSGERAITFEGRHYRVRGLHPGPPPAHPIGIWVGAYRPRMLERFVELGFDTFVLWPRGDPVAQAERFAAEVVPAFRTYTSGE